MEEFNIRKTDMEAWFSSSNFHKYNFVRDNKKMAKNTNFERRDFMLFKKSAYNKSNKTNLATI
jgi:hypothetical protein